LMPYCLTGKHIRNVVLTMRKAGGVPFDFLRITMSDVAITGVELYASHEQVSLSFSSVMREYTLQNAQGGSRGVVTGMFDLKDNMFGR